MKLKNLFNCFSNYAILSWCNCAQAGQLRSWTEPIVRYALQRVRCPCSWSRMVLDCHERLDVLGLHYNAVYDKQEPWEPWEPWLKDQVYVDVRADAGSSHCALGRCHRMESMECSCSQSLVVMSACFGTGWDWIGVLTARDSEFSGAFQKAFQKAFQYPFTVTVLWPFCVRVVYVFSLVLRTEVLRLLAWIIGGSASTAQDFLVREGNGGDFKVERIWKEITKGYERLRDA